MAVTGNVCKALAGNFGGISIARCDRCTVTGNVIDGNGVATQVTGIELAGAAYSTCVGNTIYGDQSIGGAISVNTSNFCTISGNVIDGFRDASNGYGIALLSITTHTCSDNTVVGNTVTFPSTATGSLEYGIYIDNNAVGSKSAFQNAFSGWRSLRQIRLQPIARNASWMSSRRS
jgi:nitrous oxidase accessory protein NosD